MRFTSVDSRSRSIWLLAGLGVLLWAAFSVFLSGSSAHADETPGHPAQSQSQQQSHASKRTLVASQPAARPAPDVRLAITSTTVSLAPAAFAPVEAALQPVEAAPQPSADVAPARIAAVQTSVTSLASTAPERSEPQTRQVKVVVTLLTDQKREVGRADRREPHGRQDRDKRAQNHPAAPHADHRPAHAATPLTQATPDSHSASATMRAAHASAGASVTLAAASEDTAEHFPFDSDDTSTHHQPATAPSVASAASGTSASHGVVPGASHASDVLGLLLTAAHADDDVLPSGPAGSTDNSPD